MVEPRQWLVGACLKAHRTRSNSHLHLQRSPDPVGLQESSRDPIIAVADLVWGHVFNHAEAAKQFCCRGAVRCIGHWADRAARRPGAGRAPLRLCSEWVDQSSRMDMFIQTFETLHWALRNLAREAPKMRWVTLSSYKQ